MKLINWLVELAMNWLEEAGIGQEGWDAYFFMRTKLPDSRHYSRLKCQLALTFTAVLFCSPLSLSFLCLSTSPVESTWVASIFVGWVSFLTQIAPFIYLLKGVRRVCRVRRKTTRLAVRCHNPLLHRFPSPVFSSPLLLVSYFSLAMKLANKMIPSISRLGQYSWMGMPSPYDQSGLSVEMREHWSCCCCRECKEMISCVFGLCLKFDSSLFHSWLTKMVNEHLWKVSYRLRLSALTWSVGSPMLYKRNCLFRSSTPSRCSFFVIKTYPSWQNIHVPTRWFFILFLWKSIVCKNKFSYFVFFLHVSVCILSCISLLLHNTRTLRFMKGYS